CAPGRRTTGRASSRRATPGPWPTTTARSTTCARSSPNASRSTARRTSWSTPSAATPTRSRASWCCTSRSSPHAALAVLSAREHGTAKTPGAYLARAPVMALKAAMQSLFAGYRRYRERRWPELRTLHDELATRGQRPSTLVIACSDSRVDPATIFDADPGELFVVRNVANLAPTFEQAAHGYHGVSAAIEFAVTRLGVETILVLGHAQCGGVAAA